MWEPDETGMVDEGEFPPEEGSARHPVQWPDRVKRDVPKCVTERAYEVYKSRYGNRQSLQRLNERGGFHATELIILLYAASFPEEEWRKRAEEAGWPQ